MDAFVKHGYLHRQKLVMEAAQNDQPIFEYSWGPRAKAEIPEHNMVGLISSVSKQKRRGVHIFSDDLTACFSHCLGLSRTRQ